MSGWIGVDLDGTLAHYDGWNGGKIGRPIPAMAERVKYWLAIGREVRIFTARVGLPGEEADHERAKIEAWCQEHFGVKLAVTATKDFGMVELWDDRAKQVEMNTGESYDFHLGNLLARIHRDGGHYTEEHGLDKSAKDAEKKVLKLQHPPPDPRLTIDQLHNHELAEWAEARKQAEKS